MGDKQKTEEKNKQNSVINEAFLEYNELMDAATNKAKERLSNEYPEKLHNYLKEELGRDSEITEKNNNEPTNDVDDQKNTTDMKGKKETKKDITKNSGKKDNSKVENKKNSEKDKMETEKEGKINEQEDFYDDKEWDDFESELEDKELGVTDKDKEELGLPKKKDVDAMTLDEIEQEIEKMEDIEEDLKGIKSDSPSYIDKDEGGIAFNQAVKLKKMLDEILEKGAEETGEREIKEEEHAETISDEPSEETYLNNQETDFDDEGIDFAELEDEIEAEINEDEMISSDEVEDILNQIDSDIEEGHGITHARRKGVDGKLPRKGQGLPQSHEKQLRYAVQENKKKVKNLLESNKKTTKNLNEQKKRVKALSELLENYKNTLVKTRDQLQNMAVFNTNLAHVNNIMVNEELSLTQSDKVRIIKEFKDLDSIIKSEQKYKEILSEMKQKKDTISENTKEKMESKLSNSIHESSKNKLDEVFEKTAYENNDQIKKMKKLTEYIENRGKRI